MDGGGRGGGMLGVRLGLAGGSQIASGGGDVSGNGFGGGRPTTGGGRPTAGGGEFGGCRPSNEGE